MHFSQVGRLAMYRTWIDEKVPLTHREHVYHVIEGH